MNYIYDIRYVINSESGHLHTTGSDVISVQGEFLETFGMKKMDKEVFEVGDHESAIEF